MYRMMRTIDIQSRWRVSALICAAAVLGSCSPSANETSTDSTPRETPSPTAPNRLGTFDLLSTDGRRIGQIQLDQSPPEAVSIEVSLSDRGIHPWGIFDQNECVTPPPNHDAPFQFADIEDGHRTEMVEAAPYLAFASNLVAIVFGGGGSSVLGCADLGPPQGSPVPTASSESCPSIIPSSAGEGRPELALSRDVFSNSEIFVMRDDGTDARRLTNSLGPDFKPSWSPDGEQIAFRTSRDGQDEVYIMNADGSCQRNLTQDKADDRSPAWSPDGTAIAYDHFYDSQFQDVSVMDIVSRSRRRVTTGSGEYPAWSPDGTRIAFASARDGDYEIFVINVDGTGEQQLTNNSEYDMYPAWSPDGQSIAYESGTDSFRHIAIHLMRSDGTDDRALTGVEVTNRFPAWSNDLRLAWTRDGMIVVAATPSEPPVELGQGQFPTWRP